jgi:DNA-binding IclR family transcriptional regulator
MWRIAELSRAVGLHKATTRRLVLTLEAEGFVTSDPETGEYRLGSALLPLIYVTRTNDELLRIARPFLDRLAAQTEETVAMAVWTEQGIMHIGHIQTTHFFKPPLTMGEVLTEYGTSHSKIFLAFGPEERLSRLSLGDRGKRLTIADAAALRKELDQVRETGIAYDIEERVKGVCAVGVPVRDATGEVIASISVVAPPDRFDDERRESMTKLIRETGEALSYELGYRETAT